MSFQTWCMSQQFRRQLALEHLGVLEYFFKSDYFIIKVTDRDHGDENSPQVLVPQETIKPAKTPNHSKFQLRLKQPINERNIWRANYTVWLKKSSWLCHKPLRHFTRQLKKQFMFVSQNNYSNWQGNSCLCCVNSNQDKTNGNGKNNSNDILKINNYLHSPV